MHSHFRHEEFEFCRGHSATLKLVNFVNNLSTKYEKNQHTVSIFLDIERVFNHVRHEDLIHKMLIRNPNQPNQNKNIPFKPNVFNKNLRSLVSIISHPIRHPSWLLYNATFILSVHKRHTSLKKVQTLIIRRRHNVLFLK